MTNFLGLRRTGRRSAPAGRLASAWSPTSENAIVLLALIAATFFATLQLTGSSERTAGVPGFLANALGSPQGETDATVRTPAPGVQVDVDPAGYTVRRAGAWVSVAGEGTGTAGWTAFDNGVSRRTPFGHETITVQPDKTELYLTVVRHQGVRTWRWRLGAAGLRPRLEANGGVRFVGLRGQSAINIRPVAILDASGRDITPAGLRWTLVHDRDGWWLRLRLDDRKLPLPYVIDPAANYPAPLELRNGATGVTGSWDLGTTLGAVDITTDNIPGNAAVGWYAWNPALSVIAQQAVIPTTTDGRGWLVDPAGGATGFPAGTWSFTVKTDIPNATFTAGAAVLTVGLFKGTMSGGVFTPTGTILAPTDDPAAQNLRPNVNNVTTTVNYALPKFSLAAGETLFVDYWRHQTAGIATGTAGRRQLDFHVNDGVAQIAHPAADDTGPTHTSFTVAEGTNPNRQYFNGTNIVYYNPAAAGTFVVTDAITDAGSGPYSVNFPAVNLDAGAFTHTVKTDTAAPFTSNTYAWTTSSTTAPGAQTITEEDLALQQTQTTLTISKDIAAPTAHSVALAGAGAPYYTTLSVPLTLVDGNDGTGSGLDTTTRLVERESGDLAADACTNWSGTWTTATLSGGADTNVVSGKCYRYRYKISDNVANQSAASAVSANAKVDTSAPAPAPSLTLSENPASANQHVSGTTLFYKGGAPGGSFKVTATGPADAETGIKHLGFPSVAGLTGGGTNDTGSPYEDTYSWSNTTSGSPTGSVTATNNASVAGSGTSFTLTSDTTAPTGHSVSLAGAGAPYYGTLSVPLTLVDGGDGAGAGLDTTSRVVERESGDLASDACTNWSGTWTTVTLSGGADTTVSSGKCYRYRYKISDNVGNQSAASANSADAKVDAGNPSVSVSSPTEVTGPAAQYYDSATKTHYFRPGGVGSFTLNATASDTETAITGVAFPNVSAVSGWAGSTGGNDASSPYASPANYVWTAGATAPGARTITATDKAGRTGNDTVTIAADSSAPAGHSVSLAGAGAPYYTSLSVPVTLVDGSDTGSGIDTATRIVERESGDLAADTCTNWSGSWSTVTLSGGADTTVASGKCYHYRYTISDRVGNQSAASAVSADAKVDTSAPTPAPSLTLSENPASANQHVSGTTLFYQGGAAGGSFKVTATGPADAETGIKHLGFPSVAGLTGGGTNDTGSPYEDTYSWSNTTSGSPTGSVTATNNASVAGSGTSFTLTSDTAAPTGHTVSLAGAGAPYYGTLSVPLTLVDGGDGAGSGVDSSSAAVERKEGTLSGNVCSAWSGTWAPVTLVGGADTSVVSGNCYRYRYQISDNVGNQSAPSAQSADAMVDAGDPTVSVTNPVEVTGPAAQYYDSATKTHYFRPSASGSFTLNATASDTETAVTGVAFPNVSAVSGWAGSTGGNDASSPYASPADYTWTGGATAPGARTITATDAAGRTANDTVTVAADSSVPTGQSVSLAGAGAPYYTSLSVPLTLVDGSDTGSGIDTATRIVERESGDLAADACTNWSGSWSTVTLSGSADTTVVSGKCYRYRYKISDNVANQSAASAVSADAKVDTSNPSAPSLSLAESPADPDQYVSGTDVYYSPGANGGSFTVTATASDTETGIKHVSFPGVTGVSGGGGNDTSSPYSDTYTWSNTTSGSPTGAVTATNNASATGGGTSFGLVPDSGAPSTGDDTGSIGSGWKTSAQTVTLTPSDSGAGVATTYYTTDGSTPDTSSAQGTSIPLSADGVYTIKYFSVDRVGNTEAVQTGAAQIRIDAANPSSATLDALPAAIRNGQVLSGSAADATSGVANVAYYRCTGTSCTPATLVGSSSTGPSYSVTWNSQPADGDYQVLARATDAAGNTLDSAKQTVKVDNSDPTGSLTSPAGGASVAGTVAVGSNSADSVSGVAQVVFQRSPAGAGTWTTIDTDSSAPYSVDWVTGAVADGDYDLRAVTTDAAGNSLTSGSVSVEVDNTAPTASLDDPGANLRGTVSLTGAAADPGGSGVASLTFQRSPAGGGTWTTIDTDTSSPYSISFDTTGVSDGLYDLRAVANDVAGNTTLSNVVGNRRVDNTSPTGSITAPADASVVNGLTAVSSDSADTGSGVQQVVFQRSPAGAGTWTTIDTDTSAPYSVDWATGSLADGSYDLRASATDVAGNVQTTATVSVEVDNTAPSVSITAPSAFVNAAAPDPFTVAASSPDTDLDHVEFFRCSNASTGCASGSWVSLGTDTTDPYTAQWNLDGDGNRALRAVATDLGSNTASDTDDVTIDQVAPTGGSDDPGSPLRGTVTLTGSGSDPGGSGVASLAFQRSPAGAGTWTTVDTDTSSPYSVSFDTTGVSDGLYDLRVIVTDNAGNQTTSAVVANRRVDNTAPSASLTAPADGSFVSTTVAVSANGSDPGGSGVDSVLFERRPAAGGSWTTIDTDSSSPYSVSWDTTGLADEDYELRARATDQAGNSQVSPLRTVTVDNTAPSGSLDDPGTPLRSTVSLTGSAADPGAGVASLAFQRSPASGGTWTTVDTDTSSPYSVSFDTTAVSDGLYDLRVIVTDNAGNTSVSAVVADRLVDNTAPSASLDDPGANLRGTVMLTSTASDPGGSGVASRAYEYSLAEAGAWSGTPAAFDTTGVLDGLYDLRVVVTDNAGNQTTSATVANRRVDNTAPLATLIDPGAYLSGTVTLTSVASDPGGSGVATITYQHSPAGAGAWTSTPAAFDTSGVADGLYDLRVIVTDNASNSTTSAPVTDRAVDNEAPTVSLTAPSGYVNATAPDPFTVTATSPAGDVDEVEFFRCSNSSANCASGSWVSLGTDSTAPYSASWNVDADGNRSLRAEVQDAASNSDSDVVTVTIDRTAPADGFVTYADGYDVDGSVAVATDTGTDSGSGIDLSSGMLERDEIGLAAGSCGTFAGAWASVSAPDTTVASGTCYRYRYQVADNAGNVTTYTSLNVVKVDPSAPVTTDDAPAGWSSAPVVVTLAPTDTGGSDIASTEYKVDGGAPQAGTSVSIPAPADGSNDGVHTILYRSTDAAGNVESWRTATVQIDASAPSLSPADPGDDLLATVALAATATDPSSGVESVRFQSAPAGSGTWTTIATDAAAPFTADWDTTGVSDGDYDLRFVATDDASNTTTSVLAGKTVDNTAPTVALTAPAGAATLSGSVPVAAIAADLGSGLASVSFRVRPAGGTYSTISTDTSSPFTATWDSTASADGSYELVAVASDSAGGTATSLVVTITVDNDAPVVTLQDPGTDLRGTVPLEAISSGDTALVTFERRPAGGGAWAPIGTDASAAFTTDFDTTVTADGLYELRTVALDGSNNTGTSLTRHVRVDNTFPSGSLTAPASGATVGGVVSVLATASDSAGSGVAGVTVEFRAVGAPGWTALTPDATAPYEASWDTASLPDGAYELRAGIDDLAGNASFSATAAVTVDSTAPSVTLANPGATLSGTVNLTAAAPDAFVVVFAHRATGAVSWTTVATDTAAPWSASFATGSVANGTYDLRATASDLVGNSAADVLTGIRIENTTPPGPPTDTQAPGTPPGFSGSLKGKKLTLRWGAATDASGVAPRYVLLVNGARTAVYPSTQRQTVVDKVKTGDLRGFQIQAEDEAGNASAPSYGLKVLPLLKKLTVKAAKKALAKRGFKQGKLMKKRSANVPAGRIIQAAGPTVARVGTAVPLLVSAGTKASKPVLVLRVSSLRVLARSAHRRIQVNVDLSLAAKVRTSLLEGTQELFAWRSGLGAGTTILKLDIPSQALRQSRYTLLVTAVGPDGTTTTSRIPIRLETQSTPASAVETEQNGSTPPGGSLFGDGDPPAAEPAIDAPSAAETSTDRSGNTPFEPGLGGSPAPASAEAAPRPSAVIPVSNVSATSGSSRKETVGTVLLLSMLGFGFATAGYKARALLSFVLRGLRAGSALR